MQVALRATLYLTCLPAGKLAPVREIAKATGLRGPYLAKVMGRLIRAGLVRACRGPGGGLQLHRAPQAVTLWALMQAVEGRERAEPCSLGVAGCSEKSPCPLHRQWLPVRREIERILKETTLAALAQDLREHESHSPAAGRRSSARMARKRMPARSAVTREQLGV